MSEVESDYVPINLNVKTIDSKVYELKGVVIKDQNVEDLQELVKEATGVDEDRQRLIYRGRVLERSTSLSEYKLVNNTVLHLIARPENFRELQAQAETSSSLASSAPLSSMGFLDRGTSMGIQNGGAEGEAGDTATPSTGSNRHQVPDAQSEAVEVLWQGLVSLNTLLSVTRGRESSAVPQVRREVSNIVQASSNSRASEGEVRMAVPGMAQVWEEPNSAAERGSTTETANTSGVPVTPQRPTSSTPTGDVITPGGSEGYPDARFFVGQWLDVKDTVAQWLEATVMEVDTERRRLFIHYNGWPERWDEWIDFGSNRIAPFRSITRHSSANGYHSPSPITFVQGAPRTGPADARMVLPEIARMLRQIQPLVEEAADIVQEGVNTGRITSQDTNWGRPMGGNMVWHSLAHVQSPDNARRGRDTGERETEEIDAPREATTVTGSDEVVEQAFEGVDAVEAEAEAEADRVDAEQMPGASDSDRDLARQQRDLRMAELSDQLSPLLDRFGRVLTDYSPHLRRASDAILHRSERGDGGTAGTTSSGAGAQSSARGTSDPGLASRSFRSPISNSRASALGTALSTLGASGNLMDVHLIVSPNPLVPRGAGTAVSARGGDAFSQAVSSLTSLLQTQSQILDEQIQEHSTAAEMARTLTSLARDGGEGEGEGEGGNSEDENGLQEGGVGWAPREALASESSEDARSASASSPFSPHPSQRSLGQGEVAQGGVALRAVAARSSSSNSSSSSSSSGSSNSGSNRSSSGADVSTTITSTATMGGSSRAPPESGPPPAPSRGIWSRLFQ